METGFNRLQVYMPVDLPAVEQPFMELLPENLIFYISSEDADIMNYSGLIFSKKLLYLQPLNRSFDYSFLSRKVSCRPLGKDQLLGKEDLIETIPYDCTMDELAEIAGKPLNKAGKVTDVQLVLNGEVFVISDHASLLKAHRALKLRSFSIVRLSIERAGGGTVLKNFNEILVIPGGLDKKIIGFIAIPRSAIKLEDVDPEPYQLKNSYIVHFPVIKAKVELTVNTAQFTASSKLYFLGNEVAGPVVSNHPYLPSVKQVKAILNNISFYYADPRTIIVKSDLKRKTTRVDPFCNYRADTSTSKIVVNV